jgi:hypothetical protein
VKALDKRRKRKRALIVAAFGVLLALACRALPSEYQTPCATVIKLCVGGGL